MRDQGRANERVNEANPSGRIYASHDGSITTHGLEARATKEWRPAAFAVERPVRRLGCRSRGCPAGFSVYSTDSSRPVVEREHDLTQLHSSAVFSGAKLEHAVLGV